MSARTVRVERCGERVARVVLDRPERLNALNYACVADLHDALDEVGGDDAVRVVILTGAGRGFCSGIDLKDFGTPPAVGSHRQRHAGITAQGFVANLVEHLQRTPQIVIAAVNGAAFGGGLALAAACDLRLAAASASFCSAFIRTGLTGTDVGITYFLPRLIGAARAFEMILTGRSIDAAEAERIGLVSRVVEDGALDAAALELAERVAGYTAFALRRTKEVLWHNLEASSLPAALAMENRNQELAALSPEVREFMRGYSRGVTRSGESST